MSKYCELWLMTTNEDYDDDELLYRGDYGDTMIDIAYANAGRVDYDTDVYYELIGEHNSITAGTFKQFADKLSLGLLEDVELEEDTLSYKDKDELKKIIDASDDEETVQTFLQAKKIQKQNEALDPKDCPYTIGDRPYWWVDDDVADLEAAGYDLNAWSDICDGVWNYLKYENTDAVDASTAIIQYLQNEGAEIDMDEALHEENKGNAEVLADLEKEGFSIESYEDLAARATEDEEDVMRFMKDNHAYVLVSKGKDKWYFRSINSLCDYLLNGGAIGKSNTGSILKESLNEDAHDDIQIMRVEELLEGAIGNMSDEAIDKDIKFFAKVARKLGVRFYNNVIVIIDPEGNYNPEYQRVFNVTPFTKDSTFCSCEYYDIIHEVNNGNHFLYFASEDQAKKYLTDTKAMMDESLNEDYQEKDSNWGVPEDAEEQLSELTTNFTEDSGHIRTYDNLDKIDGAKILSKYYDEVEVSDGAQDENGYTYWIISYANKKEEEPNEGMASAIFSSEAEAEQYAKLHYGHYEGPFFDEYKKSTWVVYYPLGTPLTEDFNRDIDDYQLWLDNLYDKYTKATKDELIFINDIDELPEDAEEVDTHDLSQGSGNVMRSIFYSESTDKFYIYTSY